MKPLKMAACGLDCNECGLYKVTSQQDVNAAESLVGWLRGIGLIGNDEGAEAVLKKTPLCDGCWTKTGVCWSGNCGLRTCCEEKQLNHCGECGEFPCEKYTKWVEIFVDGHQKAMEHLLSLKTNS
ncbi:MAG: DUF3795 domain-containing protein [Phycisphaerae bacterium]|nr:DUF3795 domain-containing protein [Phycisphaerae bacterium]